jgi:hypothetical protein
MSKAPHPNQKSVNEDVKKESKEKMMSPERKKRLEETLRREKHRGLLTKNFAARYGTEEKIRKTVSKLVSQYLEHTAHITESSLVQLDQQIKAALTAPVAVPSPEAQKEEAKVAARPKDADPDPAKDKKLPERREIRQLADEDKEWAAIMRFNNGLYEEDLAKEAARKREQMLKTRAELRQQMEENEKRAAQHRNEDMRYYNLQDKHLAHLAMEEKTRKAEELKRKEEEKQRLEAAVVAERMRKHKLQERVDKDDAEYVQRVKAGLTDEARRQQERKRLEREHMQTLIQENEASKKRREEQRTEQKKIDAKSIETYTKMLDQQEQARKDEVEYREKKTQELMVTMADTVLKDLAEKRRHEDELLAQHQREKDLHEQLDENARLQRIRDNQAQLRGYLHQQMEDKAKLTQQERELNVQQAAVWKANLAEYEREEKEILTKTRIVNKQNAEYLQKQVRAARSKGKTGNLLSQDEYLMNRQLLEKAKPTA